jgi:nucleoside-diphosphate-sugar epimerase
MRRVLLTGGTGFVGRQILRALLKAGVEVRLTVRGEQTVPSKVEPWPMEDLFAAPQDALEAACADVDTVIHAAWFAEPGKYLTSARNLDCLTGSLRLGQAAVSAGVRRFVGIGTCFEYDLAAGYLRPTTPLAPHTLYGATKASTYLTLERLMAQEARYFAWCRLFYLHGEGEDPRRLVPYLRARLAAGEPTDLTSGRQIRDYLDVEEAGRRIVAVALSTIEGAVNICSGQPVTVAQLAGRIAEEFGRTDLLRFGARADDPGDPPCVIGEPIYV